MAFQYDPWIQEEVTRVLRGMFPSSFALAPATEREDFGGIDMRYMVGETNCPLQVRCRRDRPAGSEDCDITLRHTEPSMITAHTYAPFMAFFWFVNHHIIAGRLIDVYRMADHLDPPLDDRDCIANFDGRTGFVCVTIPELCQVQALLRIYDGTHWATSVHRGDERIHEIMKQYRPPPPPPFGAGGAGLGIGR